MKMTYNKVLLEPDESFTCREWRRFKNVPLVFLSEYLLTAIIKLRGTLYIGDTVGPFRDGDLFFFAPKLPHYWVIDPRDVVTPWVKGDVITATFGEDFLGEPLFQSPEGQSIRHLLARSRRGMVFPNSVSAAVVPDLRRLTRLKGWKRLCLFLDILGRLAEVRKFRLLASSGFISEIEEQDLGRLSVVCKFVHESYARGIREKEVATMVSLSPAHFSRYFRQRMGCTFVNYLTQVRINEACRRLAGEESSILDIALETGFNNLSNFNRHFLMHRKMTPREYRRHHADIPSAGGKA